MIEPASPYVHYYNRGVNKDIIFFAPENYVYLLAKLSEFIKNYQVELITYCLMPNHYHILLKHENPAEGSSLIQRIFNSYTQAINKKYSRVGTLFQENVKKRIIEDDDYLAETIKYIHLNPVKANLCLRPENWIYSDYREWIELKESSRNISSERDNIFGSATDYAELINLEF
jgi:putative transposase